MSRTRIIGLGNSILTDDGVGVYAARRLKDLLQVARPEVDVIEAEVAGFALLEMLVGWERVILIDAVQFGGVDPGTVMQIEASDLHTSLRLRSVHEIDLPTVLALGEKLGYAMPKELVIYVVQGADILTLGERLTPAVAEALPRVIEAVLSDVGVVPRQAGMVSFLPLTSEACPAPTLLST